MKSLLIKLFFFKEAYSLSGWILNFGVVPLFSFWAFLFLPIFDFLLALLFLVTRVLETIFQLLNHLISACNPNSLISNHRFLPARSIIVKGVVLFYLFLPTYHSFWARGTTKTHESALKSLTLTKGEIKTVTFKSLSRFTVGNKEIITVKTLTEEGKLLIKAKSQGVSDLILWKKGQKNPEHFSISVIDKKTQLKLLGPLRDMNAFGIKAKLLGKKLFVSGKIKDETTYNHLVAINLELKDQITYVDLELSADLKAKIYRKFIQYQLQLSLPQLHCSPGQLFIKCRELENLKKARLYLNKHFLISWMPFEESQKHRQFEIGLYLHQYENKNGEAFSLGLSSLNSTWKNILLKNPLSLIENNHTQFKKENFKSQVLANPKVIGQLNQPIIIKVGQEIPYLSPSTNTNFSTQEWKFAGLHLEVTLKPHSEKLIIKYKNILSKPNAERIVQNFQESSLIVSTNQTRLLFDIGFKVSDHNHAHLPFLYKIPLFGSLFTDQEHLNSYKKIICFIEVKEILL